MFNDFATLPEGVRHQPTMGVVKVSDIIRFNNQKDAAFQPHLFYTLLSNPGAWSSISGSLS
ncbi:MAG: hypothetical protein LBK25_02335 [Treponema sp.]|nr:hypothetical protein [Treponema sp.]